MVTPWMLWTDGSCKHMSRPVSPTDHDGLVFGDVRPEVMQQPVRGPGGWAAIVEHHHDGYVVKGRVERTTNVRMELLAAVMALRQVPDGGEAILHTDCTTVLLVAERHRRCLIGAYRGRDRGLWEALAGELGRVDATIRYLEREQRDHRHRRAHLIAGAEATAAYLGYDPPMRPRLRIALGHSVVARL